MLRIQAFLSLAFLLATACASAQHAGLIPSEMRPFLERMAGKEPAARANASLGLKLQLRSLQEHLLNIVDVEAKSGYLLNDERQLAAEILASMGTPRAVSVFVKRIDNGPLPGSDSPLSYAVYPNAVALAQFGKSGVDVIVAYLLSVGNDAVSNRAIELYAEVIRDVYHASPDPSASASKLIEESGIPVRGDAAINRLVDYLVLLKNEERQATDRK